MSRVIPLSVARPREPKPEWLKVRAPGSPSYLRLKGLMRELDLHTVCEEARCPNIGECWNHGTATFMILGDVCTRACSYCAVAHGRPGAVDPPSRRAWPKRSRPRPRTTSSSRRSIATISRTAARRSSPRRFAQTRGAPAAVPDRGAHSRFSGRRGRAAHACSTPAPTSSTTTPRPCRGSIAWRGRADATSARSSCSIGRAAMRPTSRRRPA